jgi:hypothetical protein
MGEEALLLEHRELVADRRRRHVQVGTRDKGLRADRVSAGDVLLDNPREDLLLPRRETGLLRVRHALELYVCRDFNLFARSVKPGAAR